MTTDKVAYGIYPDRQTFERALEALRAAGFRNSDISAILPERDQTTRDLAHEIDTKTPEGVAAGAGTGAALGGCSVGWSVSARSPSPASDLWWRRDRCSPRWPAPVREVQPAVSLVD